MDKFVKLYIDTNRLVYAFICKYTKDYEIVNEIASTVWLKVANDTKKFLDMEPQHLKNYLKAMVRTAYADYYKQQKREEKKLEAIRDIMCKYFE